MAGLVNNVSFKMPPSPLLTQLEDVPPSMFCGEGFCSEHDICECINLIKIPLGSVVEFMIVDTSELLHWPRKDMLVITLRKYFERLQCGSVFIVFVFLLPKAHFGSCQFLYVSYLYCTPNFENC